MKRITVGILAHVDSGKTTLSEAILFNTGNIRKLGRVDNGDCFLDNFELERKRGITIFSKQAIINIENTEFTLVDTPGHIDFSPETERTLRILDIAILVVSGIDGVQSHTLTLWKLLEKYNIPTFIFVNKTDMSIFDRESVLSNVKNRLSPNCVDGTQIETNEETALCSEDMMQSFLEIGEIDDNEIIDCIYDRKLFPCYFGSALKNNGIDFFISQLDRFTRQPKENMDFGARVFKISNDNKNTRMAFVKITGGELKVKDSLVINGTFQKVDQIRVYSGDKFELVQSAKQGTVCAITGLTDIRAGDGIGFEKSDFSHTMQPIMRYRVNLPPQVNPLVAYKQIKSLEEQEPLLDVTFDEALNEIYLLLMGEIQFDVIKHKIFSSFGFDVTFDNGRILYRETIRGMVEGVGHYEPLCHYAEVHLLIEEAKNSGCITAKADCDSNALDKNFQNLVLSHILEKKHIGVLTGTTLTDVKITLVAGKSHKKHTEGGDFRQATYRAIRQGLMKADSVLLEPWYSFEISLPNDKTGRLLADIKNIGGKSEISQSNQNVTVVVGKAPVICMRDYIADISNYTKGEAKIVISSTFYDECHNPQEVIEQIGYIPEKDTENSADSIFCVGGSGLLVPYNEVENYMHIESCLRHKQKSADFDDELRIRAENYRKNIATDNELIAIFERTYGKIKPRTTNVPPKAVTVSHKDKVQLKTKDLSSLKEYLLIDGYNIIFAIDEFKAMAKQSLDSARNELINRLCNYQVFYQNEVILVFDAYKVKGNVGAVEKINNISVVYTKEAETADSYIEKVSKTLAKNNKVRVATSDGLEQMIILGNGALRVPAAAFYRELCDAEKAIREYLCY